MAAETTTNPRTFFQILAINAVWMLGLIFLAAGLAKLVDLNEAVRQAGAYSIVGNRTLLLVLVWLLTLVECVLGVSLLVFYRVRLGLVATSGLLMLFFAVLGYAWSTGVTEDCGCFGQWAPRTPGQAMLEDLGILVLLVVAWMGYKPTPSKDREGMKGLAVASAAVASLAIPFFMGFSLSSVLIPGVQGPAVEPLAIESGEAIDWEQEPYIIELMSTDCHYCQESVMDVNILADSPGVPKIVALCTNTSEEVETFNQTYFPEYPLLRVNEEHYWRLVATGASPRFLLVQKGHVIHAWEIHPPTAEEVLSLLEQKK